jgi:hypothetical protein
VKEKQEFLGRTNPLFSFDTTGIACKTKKLRGMHIHTDNKVIS